jgi:predicted RNA-binding Zn-ribbon protein involved in translation (DUF1610 family)
MTMTCPVCGETFEDDEKVRNHDHEMPIAWQNSGAGFQCPVCGAMVDEEEDLIAHEAAAHAGGTAPPGADRAERAEPS